MTWRPLLVLGWAAGMAALFWWQWEAARATFGLVWFLLTGDVEVDW